jgi:hypothetical protein
VRAHGGQELLDVGGLVMLLARKLDAHELLCDAGVDLEAGPGRGRARSEDLEGALVERRRRLDGDRLRDRALAGEAVAVANEVFAELHAIPERGGRDRAGDELHTARRAAAAAPTDRVDVDAVRVCRAEDGGSGIDVEDAAHARITRDDRERDRHSRVIVRYAPR